MKVLMISNNNGPAVRLQVAGLQATGIHIKLLVLDRVSMGRAVYIKLRHSLQNELAEYVPDIVHVQFGGVQAAVTAAICPQRTVVTFHGTDLHGGSRTPNWICTLSQRVGVWCSHYAAKRVAFNILVSENLRSYLPARSAPAEVIPTGVDFERFMPKDRQACLATLGLNPNVHWILFCDQNRDPVKRRDIADAVISDLRKLDISATLLTLNGVNHDQVPIYLNAVSALLITSDKEGSPNIVKEALACNTPVISVNVGDVATRIHGLDACEVCPHSSQHLANAVARVVKRTCRPDIRNRVRSQFDNTLICQRIMNLYEHILCSHAYQHK